MKWVIVVALAAYISLVGCQNISQKENLSIPAQEEGGAKTTDGAEVEPDIVEENVSPSAEGESAAPSGEGDKPDAAPLIDEGGANANVLFVKAQLATDLTWTFVVTVEHPDNGWEDYADGWDVVLPDGTVVKPAPGSPFTRLLLHPHETEQPFTRSQGGIKIPPDIKHVTVRAHDLVDGFGGIEVIVDLTAGGGSDFEVVR